MSTMTNNNNSSPKNDRPSIALEVYAALCHAEGKGQANVALTGIRMIGCSPLRTGTQDVFIYVIADILADICAKNGYTKNLQGFIASAEMFHVNKNTGASELVIPKRMQTSVNSLYRSAQFGGKKYMNSMCAEIYGADWWKVDKQLRQEAVLLRAIEGTLQPLVKKSAAVEPIPAPTNDFAAQFAQYKTVAPMPAPTPAPTTPTPAPAPVAQTVEEMLEQLRANGSTTIPNTITVDGEEMDRKEFYNPLVPQTLTIESSKAELAAVVSKKLGIDNSQAMLMNKETLVSLL